MFAVNSKIWNIIVSDKYYVKTISQVDCIFVLKKKFFKSVSVKYGRRLKALPHLPAITMALPLRPKKYRNMRESAVWSLKTI